MDPTELIKAAPEIAKGLTAVGAAIPFTSIVKKMLGPAADELAEMWRDQVRLYRYGRQLKCIEKAEKMAQDAGFTPKAVPPKILFPLLEGASFEEDENLHDMWASLLANASSPDHTKTVRPSFIFLLRTMAHDEAALLKTIWDEHLELQALPETDQHNRGVVSEISDKYRRMFPQIASEDDRAETSRYWICMETLRSASLINTGGRHPNARGVAFLAACSPPKPKP
jgi:Abortive infection alpha